MSCPIENKCACGDRLIHQWRRGFNESSSAFGQFVHDHVTSATTISDLDVQHLYGSASEMVDVQLQQLHFTFGDIQRLRVFEHKSPGGGLSTGQKWLLPIWRRLVHLGIKDQHISTASGVYVVESEPPFDALALTKHIEGGETEHREFDRHGFVSWMGGPRT